MIGSGPEKDVAIGITSHYVPLGREAVKREISSLWSKMEKNKIAV